MASWPTAMRAIAIWGQVIAISGAPEPTRLDAIPDRRSSCLPQWTGIRFSARVWCVFARHLRTLGGLWPQLDQPTASVWQSGLLGTPIRAEARCRSQMRACADTVCIRCARVAAIGDRGGRRQHPQRRRGPPIRRAIRMHCAQPPASSWHVGSCLGFLSHTRAIECS